MIKKSMEISPSKPVIISQMAAKKTAEHWTEQNDKSFLIDADGFRWSLSKKLTDQPTEHFYLLSIELHSNLDKNNLVAAGTLDPKKDARLILLLGEDTAHARLFSKEIQCRSRHEARSYLVSWTEELESELSQKSLHRYRRKIIENHVNLKCRYFSTD